MVYSVRCVDSVKCIDSVSCVWFVSRDNTTLMRDDTRIYTRYPIDHIQDRVRQGDDTTVRKNHGRFELGSVSTPSHPPSLVPFPIPSLNSILTVVVLVADVLLMGFVKP